MQKVVIKTHYLFVFFEIIHWDMEMSAEVTMTFNYRVDEYYIFYSAFL
jgi:hypothetical protein